MKIEISIGGCSPVEISGFMSKIELTKPDTVVTLDKLKKEFEKVLVMKDQSIVPTICASIIGNRLPMDPVWIMIVAASSGGKTEILNAFSGLEFVHSISDLTVNTLASGMMRHDKEPSLLFKINNGIVMFKDFTTILGKDPRARDEILAQFRRVYDGEFEKETGTGESIHWKGKVGAIGAVTEVIYKYDNAMSSGMGERFILYNLEQPDRIEVSKRSFENGPYMQEYRAHLQECVNVYMRHCLDYIDNNDDDLDRAIELTGEAKDELMNIADFATRARSAVMTDFKTGHVDFVPSIEMPTRMVSQLQTILSALVLMERSEPGKNRGEIKIKQAHLDIAMKIAFSSVPRTRRDVLIPLAQYVQGVTTKAMGTKLNLHSDMAKKYLFQINALGLCDRINNPGPQGDKWKLKPRFRKMLLKAEDLTEINDELIDDEEEEEVIDEELFGDEWDLM